MTPGSFRKLALSLPGAIEGSHMGHADFRVGGKIFATLGYPRDGWAALALTPEDQDAFVKMHPKAFVPVIGQVSVALEAAYETRQARSRRKRR